MDPITAVGAGLAVLGSKPILEKVLGPSADLVGGEIKNLVQRCNVNLDGIFRKAVKKLGPRIDAPGAVPARVLKQVWDEGRFIEDELSAEYYGGILAASRTGTSRDDRALTYLALVKNLSTYQIRTHYIVYRVLRESGLASGRTEFRARMAGNLRIAIPISVFEKAMAFDEKEEIEFEAITTHCILGLVQQSLFHAEWQMGNVEDLKKVLPGVNESSFVVRPTLLGAALYLWASGVNGATGRELLTAELIAPPKDIDIQPGAIVTGW